MDAATKTRDSRPLSASWIAAALIAGVSLSVAQADKASAPTQPVTFGAPVVDWTSYLGGRGRDEAWGIAADQNGNVYVTGRTLATEFHTPNGPDETFYGGSSADHAEAERGKAFVTKLVLQKQPGDNELPRPIESATSQSEPGRTFEVDVVDGETSRPVPGILLSARVNEKEITATSDDRGVARFQLPDNGIVFFSIENVPSFARQKSPRKYRIRELVLQVEAGDPGRAEAVVQYLRDAEKAARSEDAFNEYCANADSAPRGAKITERGELRWVDEDYRGGSFASLLARLPAGRIAGPYRDGDEYFLLWLVERSPADFYVPLHASLAMPWWPIDRRTIPDRFTFRLEPGAPIGGTVCDENDEPVPGVKITLSIPRSQSTTETVTLDFKNVVVMTDSKGRWRCNSVPREFASISIHADHYDFAPAVARDISHPERLFQLCEQTYKTTLTKEGLLRGVVIGPNGPIAGARVSITSDLNQRERYFAETDAEGRFRFAGLVVPKQYVIVSAPGFALRVQEVELSRALPVVSIQLGAGWTLRGRVIDDQGNPIPEVDVYAASWISFVTPNWIGQTNDEGRFVWEHAPDASLTLNFFRDGYIAFSQRNVVPGGDEILFQMSRRLTVRGRVIDAATSKPISEYRITPGYSIRGGSEYWDKQRARSFHNPDYEIEFAQRTAGYRVMIEADGYWPEISPEFQLEDQEVIYDVILKTTAAEMTDHLLPEKVERQRDGLLPVDDYTAALWRFNRAGAETVLLDSGPYKNHGEIQGARWVEGYEGDALEFDGQNDLVVVPGHRSLNIRDYITIEMLVRPAPQPGFRRSSGDHADGIVDRGTGLQSHGGYYVRLMQYFVDFAVSTPYTETLSRTGLQTNRWYYIAAVYDDRTARIYINGELDREATLGNGNLDFWSDAGLLTIGKEGYRNYFTGTIDEMRISDRARSAKEIRENWFLIKDPEAARLAKLNASRTSHTLVLKVVNAKTRRPIPDVDLEVRSNSATISLRTNSDGRAKTLVPADAELEYVVARKAGFVPIRATLMSPMKAKERTIETLIRQTLEMPPARPVGGRIVDAKGEAIAGATITITLPPTGNDLSGRIFVEDFKTETDSEGRWTCDVTPADLGQFQLVVAHEETASQTLSIESESDLRALGHLAFLVSLKPHR